jgi:hypothetical protein
MSGSLDSKQIRHSRSEAIKQQGEGLMVSKGLIQVDGTFK